MISCSRPASLIISSFQPFAFVICPHIAAFNLIVQRRFEEHSPFCELWHPAGLLAGNLRQNAYPNRVGTALRAQGFARPGRRCREKVREASQREEAFSAGIAAIGGKAQSPLEPTQPAFVHPGARDALQIEVSASRAVSHPGVRSRYKPRIKAFLAGKASPRAQSEKGHPQIAPAVSARTAAQITAAARTDHTAFPQSRFSGTRILEIPFEDNRGWKARAV